MYKRNVFERIHDLSELISDDDYFSTGNLLFEYYVEYQYGYNLYITKCIMIWFIIKLFNIHRDKRLMEMDLEMENQRKAYLELKTMDMVLLKMFWSQIF